MRVQVEKGVWVWVGVQVIVTLGVSECVTSTVGGVNEGWGVTVAGAVTESDGVSVGVDFRLPGSQPRNTIKPMR